MTRKSRKSEILNFEDSLENLKAIVSELENGKLTLRESLERYEEGIKSLKDCHEALNSAQLKIEQLVRLDENGRLITKPYDDTASFEHVPPRQTSGSRCPDTENSVKSKTKSFAKKINPDLNNLGQNAVVEGTLDEEEAWEVDPLAGRNSESGSASPSSTPSNLRSKGKSGSAADRFLNFDDDT
jgi:exodeoxyribonuclease VII small subunit